MLDPDYRLDPKLTLVALGLSLLGFLAVAYLLYSFKIYGTGPTLHGLPTRVLFVFALALAAAPMMLAIFRRPPVLAVLPAVALVFLLYPLFTPYGIPSGQDAIFNYQFADAILLSGRWAPTLGVTYQAVAYSYYPASAVFNAELASFTGLPLLGTYLWGVPLLRLLMLPAIIYAVGHRYFGQRVAFVALLIFMATPSIEFNYPVQSEFAIPFFALLLMMLGYLVVGYRWEQGAVLTTAVVLAAFVVMSHHLTSYILMAWLAGLLLLWGTVRSFASRRVWLAGAAIGGYVAFFVAYTYEVSLPNFTANYQSLLVVANEVRHYSTASVGAAASVGSSFPEYQLAWTYVAYLGLIVLAVLTARQLLRTEPRRFVTPNLIIAILAAVLALPFLATAFNFVSERVMEYSEVFIAPGVAWWLLHRLMPAVRGRAASPAPGHGRPRALSRARGALAAALVLGLVVIIFTGGSLVPYSTRDQFAPPDAISTESPLHIDLNSYDLALWAESHLTSSSYVWGDFLTLCVFSGFGRFNMQFDQYQLFNGTTIPLVVWAQVTVGSYVVLDKYMTDSIPQFPGPSNDQPTAPLTPGQLAKFDNPTYFDRVYQDSTYTIYQVIAVP